MKLVRDRFTFTENEYEQLSLLKKRLADQRVISKKSELVRAALALFANLDDTELKEALARIPSIG